MSLRPAGRIALLVALLAFAALVVPGCSGQTESLVGIWWSSEQGETLDFQSDGTLLFRNAAGEVETLVWQSDDRNVAIGVEGGGTRTLGYSIKDGVLTLTYPDEEPAHYERITPQTPGEL